MKWKIALLALLVPVGIYAANELSVNTSLVYNKDGVVIQDSKNLSVTVSDTPIASGVLTISTNATAVSFGTVTNAGYALLFNRTTNSWSEIKWGTVSGAYPFTLPGNRAALVYLNTNSITAIAVTNAPTGGPDLQYIIFSR